MKQLKGSISTKTHNRFIRHNKGPKSLSGQPKKNSDVCYVMVLSICPSLYSSVEQWIFACLDDISTIFYLLSPSLREECL